MKIMKVIIVGGVAGGASCAARFRRLDEKADYDLEESELCYAPPMEARKIPLPEHRLRLGDLPRDREILIICRSAQRAYMATRILLQNGFKARNISGGMLSRSHYASD
jgi:rhodanese-related sulfurtransferase